MWIMTFPSLTFAVFTQVLIKMIKLTLPASVVIKEGTYSLFLIIDLPMTVAASAGDIEYLILGKILLVYLCFNHRHLLKDF